MSGIFISYCSARRDLTRDLEARLRAKGYDQIWWDTLLDPVGEFGPQIKEQLGAARVVLVIWTPEAVRSAYVRAEARLAWHANKLVSVRTPDTPYGSIPEPFGERQIAELADLDEVIRAITGVWQGRAPENALLAEHYFRNTGLHVLAAKQERLDDHTLVTPAMLLNARYALSPFMDTHGLRTDLLQWAQADRPVAGKLIHGPGGLGKTRLMVEVCAELRKQGWAAGFVETPPETDRQAHRQALEQLIDTERGAGLLLVLDYAERRHEEAAVLANRMTVAARNRPGRSLRLALLSRAAGDWWDRALGDSSDLQKLFGPTDVLKLTALTSAEDRERLLDGALTALRDRLLALGRPVNDASAEALRSAIRRDPNFDRPLMIQAAALLHLEATVSDEMDSAALLDAMVRLERHYWRLSLGTSANDSRLTAVGRGAAQITLANGATRGDAESLLLSDKYYARVAPSEVAAPLGDLLRFYGSTNEALRPVEPDLIGEHLAATEGDERLLEACLGWAGQDRSRRRNILTLLNRASREEHGSKAARATALLNGVILAHSQTLAEDIVAVALETPGTLAQRIRDLAPTLELDACDALLSAVPGNTQRLAAAAQALAEAIVRHLRLLSSTTRDAKRISFALTLALNNHATRLLAVGRNEDALEASGESAEIGERFSSADLQLHLPTSYQLQGSALVQLGRFKEAFVPASKGLAIRRRRAAIEPGERYQLAGELLAMSVVLSGLNRMDEAHSAVLEATSLTTTRSSPVLDSAMMLLKAQDASNHEQTDEAVKAAEDAVAMTRRLADQSPDAFIPNLAINLLGLQLILAETKYRDRAVKIGHEAVELLRELTTARPKLFLPMLSESLGRLTFDLLSNNEDHRSALQELVTIRRRLAAEQPDRFLLPLASSLNLLGEVQLYDGHAEEALPVCRESVQIRRSFLGKEEYDLLPLLGASLSTLDQVLWKLRKREEAFETSRELIEIYRKLALKDPEDELPTLARKLNILSEELHTDKRLEEAVSAAGESAEIRRKLAHQHPEKYLPMLAMSLGNVSCFLEELARPEEELRACRELVDIHRQLIKAEPSRFLPDLARWLTGLGDCLGRLNRLGEALDASQESVRIFRNMSVEQPGGSKGHLAASLGCLAQILSLFRRFDESLSLAREALDLIEPIRATDPDAARLAVEIEGVIARCKEGTQVGAATERAPAQLDTGSPLEGLGWTPSRSSVRRRSASAWSWVSLLVLGFLIAVVAALVLWKPQL